MEIGDWCVLRVAWCENCSRKIDERKKEVAPEFWGSFAVKSDLNK